MQSYQPAGYHTVTPRIFTPDPEGLVRFIQEVFGAHGTYEPGVPAEVRIGDSVVMVSDGGGQRDPLPAFLYVYVPDAEATYVAAVRAGATTIEEPATTPYGDRRATVRDQWNNTWQIATRLP